MARTPTHTPEWINYNEVDPGTADGGHDDWIPILSMSPPINEPGSGSAAAKGGHDNWIPIQTTSPPIHKSGSGSSATKGGHSDWIPIQTTSPPISKSDAKPTIKIWADPKDAGALAPHKRYVELRLRDQQGNGVKLRGAQVLSTREAQGAGGTDVMQQEWELVYEGIQRVHSDDAVRTWNLENAWPSR